jgi:hypothetical protein
MTDTLNVQKRLVTYGKNQHARIDILYQQWLQLYIIELNQWKANKLSDLEDDLEDYRKQVINTSEMHISQVNIESKQYKSGVVSQE